MRSLVVALVLSSASVVYAQTGCSASSSSSLPETSGCLPATFTPADGGPSRPVLLDVQFMNFQGGSVRTAPTAVKVREMAIGAFGSYTEPDYNGSVNTDVGVFVEFTAKYLGVQADASDTVINRGGVRESSAVIGPRFQVPFKTLVLYAKAQAGAGRFSGSPLTISNKTIGAVEQYGGGLEWNPTRHLKVRVADYSYQVWPEFSVHNLSPTVISSGLALRF